MRLIFMGTPEFAVPSLRLLVESGYSPVAVVTAPDHQGGRGGKQLLQSAVKKYAVEQGLPLLQPPKLKAPDFLEQLRALRADLQIVVAFRMLPEAVWNMPRLGTFNLHASLLPLYRGAAPLNWAIINGETETGLTTFFLKHEIDTGDLLFQEKTPIYETETVGELHDRLKEAGARLVLKTVQAIERGDYTPMPQDTSRVSHAPKLFANNCRLDFDRPVQAVYNHIRGLSPYPTAWTPMPPDGAALKVFAAEKIVQAHQYAPGTFLTDARQSRLLVAAQDGFLNLTDVQPAAKKRMSAQDFLHGHAGRFELMEEEC